MKKVNVLQLIASICMLVGSLINLLNLCTEIPFEVYVCSVPLLFVSVILYIVVLVQKIRIKKNKKEDGN